MGTLVSYPKYHFCIETKVVPNGLIRQDLLRNYFPIGIFSDGSNCIGTEQVPIGKVQQFFSHPSCTERHTSKHSVSIKHIRRTFSCRENNYNIKTRQLMFKIPKTLTEFFSHPSFPNYILLNIS